MMRLFLTSRAEGTLFDAIPPQTSREEFLRMVFGADHNFRYWQKNYFYKAFPQKSVDNFALGVIAHEHNVTISGPPQEEFAHKDVPDWDTANVFVDVSDHSDGQKLACQSVRGIGEPVGVLRRLVDEINSRYATSDWHASINPITDQDDFWKIAERNKGNIGELDLTFVTPNIWRGQSETEKALRALQQENNAQEVEVRLRNDDKKLNPDSENVRQSIDYIAKGGGSVVLREDGQKKLYDSDSNVTVTPVDDDEPIQDASEGVIRDIINRLFGR